MLDYYTSLANYTLLCPANVVPFNLGHSRRYDKNTAGGPKHFKRAQKNDIMIINSGLSYVRKLVPRDVLTFISVSQKHPVVLVIFPVGGDGH